jgi:hypothetical protein
MTVSIEAIVRDSLLGLAVVSPLEPIKAPDAVYVLGQLNLIIDDWLATRAASFAAVFTPFVTTGANPQTIGPTGQWVLPSRPVSIDGASLSVGSFWNPITVHDDPAWWEAQSGSTVGTLTELFYSPDEPNGSIYFVGAATAGQTVRLQTRGGFAPVTLVSTMELPPGYQSALTLTLMENSADAFHAVLTDRQIQRAGKARARIFGNNLVVPKVSATRQGVPGMTGGWFDVRSGQWRT